MKGREKRFELAEVLSMTSWDNPQENISNRSCHVFHECYLGRIHVTSREQNGRRRFRGAHHGTILVWTDAHLHVRHGGKVDLQTYDSGIYKGKYYV